MSGFFRSNPDIDISSPDFIDSPKKFPAIARTRIILSPTSKRFAMNPITNKSYIVIIGAGEELGRELAIAFARQQKHLILVSHTGDTLLDLCGYLENEFDVVAYSYDTDFTEKEMPYIFADWVRARFSIEGLALNGMGKLAETLSRDSANTLGRLLVPLLNKAADPFYFVFHPKGHFAENELQSVQKSALNYSAVYLKENSDQSCGKIAQLAVAAAVREAPFNYPDPQLAEKLNHLY